MDAKLNGTLGDLAPTVFPAGRASLSVSPGHLIWPILVLLARERGCDHCTGMRFPIRRPLRPILVISLTGAYRLIAFGPAHFHFSSVFLKRKICARARIRSHDERIQSRTRQPLDHFSCYVYLLFFRIFVFFFISPFSFFFQVRETFLLHQYFLQNRIFFVKFEELFSNSMIYFFKFR